MIQFDYGGNILELPNPDLGDNRRIGHNDSVTNNRDGELLNITNGQIVKDTLSWSIRRIREAKKLELETYFKTYQAQPFTVTDHNARVFTAIVTNTELEIVTVKDVCSYNINLELLEL